ncbi:MULTISPECIES: AraC family transcriptional regulator [unclassified Gordonia (in: high G+C Gram-positive bacteria)]
MVAFLDLENLPVTDKIEFLRERMACAPVPLALDPHDGADVIAHSRVADLGRVHLLSTKAYGADVVRTESLIRNDTAPPALLVTVVESGTSLVVRHDHAMTLRAGDMGICLTNEPYRLRFTDGTHRHTYQIPLDGLDLPVDLIRRPLETPMIADRAITASVSAFLRTTARTAPDASEADKSSLERPIIDLIRLQLTRVVADTSCGRRAATMSLATRVEEYVLSRSSDPDLSAKSVAEAFSISERYVYKILARRGIDLGELIRSQRLESALRLLEDSRNDSMTVSMIAYRCGFHDHAHFSRAFRNRFGTTPSQWRRQSRHNGATG